MENCYDCNHCEVCKWIDKFKDKGVCDFYENEPCGDAINRQAVLNTLDRMDKALDTDRTVESYKELLTECYKDLPPVNPQKTGHWNVVSDGYGDSAYICECSECKDTVWVYKDADRKWNYCPNCGAKMVEQERSDKE